MSTQSPPAVEKPKETWDLRTHLLMGEENCKIIETTKFLLIGTHPALSFASEFLVRAGAKNLTLVYPQMNSTVAHSLHAFTVGQQSEQDQLTAINPEACISVVNKPFTDELLKTYISMSDVVMNGIEELPTAAQAVYYCEELGKKHISVIGGYGVLDSSTIKVLRIDKSKKGNYIQLFKEELAKKGIRKGVFTVHSTYEGEGGVSYVFSVMAIRATSYLVDSITQRKSGEKLQTTE